jgi:hypothetical protein
MPRSIGRLGAGAWTMASQQAHASLGRTWRITREAGWHEFQLLGHVLAQRPQAATTGQAGVDHRRIHFFVTWQMLRQRPAYRLLAWRLIDSRHLARSFGLVGLQVFQLQLQLLDLMIQLFRHREGSQLPKGRVEERHA